MASISDSVHLLEVLNERLIRAVKIEKDLKSVADFLAKWSGVPFELEENLYELYTKDKRLLQHDLAPTAATAFYEAEGICDWLDILESYIVLAAAGRKALQSFIDDIEKARVIVFDCTNALDIFYDIIDGYGEHQDTLL
jgi:hypothetical protein